MARRDARSGPSASYIFCSDARMLGSPPVNRSLDGSRSSSSRSRMCVSRLRSRRALVDPLQVPANGRPRILALASERAPDLVVVVQRPDRQARGPGDLADPQRSCFAHVDPRRR
jgi:hypothetical protein